MVSGAVVSIVQVRESGRLVGVAGGVGRPHREGVLALGQRAVGLGRGAATRSCPQSSLHSNVALGVVGGERRTSPRSSWSGRIGPGVDRGLRRGRVDRPGRRSPGSGRCCRPRRSPAPRRCARPRSGRCRSAARSRPRSCRSRACTRTSRSGRRRRTRTSRRSDWSDPPGPSRWWSRARVVSTVQVGWPGVWSVLPAASVARTEKVCGPSARRVVGLGRGAGLEAAGVELALERGARVVGGELERRRARAGRCPMGRSRSSSRARSCRPSRSASPGVWSVLPAASVARTEKVCSPSDERAVGLRRRAGLEAARVELALEGGVRLARRRTRTSPRSSWWSGRGPERIVVSGAVVSIVQVWLAGVWSVLPAVSVARTENVCEPSLRPVYVWPGNKPRSCPRRAGTRTWRSGSSEENSNVASVELVGSNGPASIEVSGAVVSTVHVRVSGDWSVLPRASVARTENVCSPSARELYVCGEEQDS